MKPFSLQTQKGASVTSIVCIIIGLGLLGKLGVGVIPAYIGEYQFNKLVQQELQKANDAKSSEKQFMNNLGQQLSINANYNTKPEEVLVFTNKTPGALAVRTNYSEESVFYGNTVIVNRFSAEITGDSIKKVPPTIADNREKVSLK